MAPTVKILNLSKNELTSVWELSKMQGLKLEELWLQGNPVCDTSPDQSTYVRSPGQPETDMIPQIKNQLREVQGSSGEKTVIIRGGHGSSAPY
ncbi:nuclear RNA export factor 5-like [Monodon monoceros]|uniref:nuclear RNA export factor 5-like n=1 Tax=Monodon monoceros TaxID=40151 RepID=UPI0010F7FF42|nr:nuclear RNA export factor 5-like [Monodon monoceros]